MDDFDSDFGDGIGSFNSTTAPSQPSNRDSDDDTWTPRKRSSKKAKKPKRKAAKKSGKTRILRGRLATGPSEPVYEDVPENHFFVLPAELRNRIYEDVIDDETTTTSMHYIPARKFKRSNGYQYVPARDVAVESKITKRLYNGQPHELPLLFVCHQMRNETLSMYYAKAEFRLCVTPRQLTGVCQWLAEIKEKHGCETNNFTPIHKFNMEIFGMDWADLGYLEALAHIVHEHCDSWGDLTWGVNGLLRRRQNMDDALNEIVKMGQEAAEEEWDSSELTSRFEDWLVDKLDDKWVKLGMRRGLSIPRLEQDGGVEPLRKGLAGQLYASENLEDTYDDADNYSRVTKRSIPTTDRVTRSRKSAPVEKTREKRHHKSVKAQVEVGEQYEEDEDDDGLDLF